MERSYKQKYSCLRRLNILFIHPAAGIAQLVERLIEEREVVGSVPGAGPTLRVLK